MSQIYIEKKIVPNETIPDRLFACFADITPETGEILKEIEENDKAGRPIPSFLVQHAFNRLGPGGTTAMGYDWESGPSGDSLYDLTVFSVGSMEMARLLRENDPFTQNGLFYDPEYFEWSIHIPFRKASPGRRQVLKKLLDKVT
jgi:hypothetical protein